MQSVLDSEKKLLTQTEAAEKLAVSLDLLASWNLGKILTPTQVIDGQNYYSEEQINLFLKIRQLAQEHKIGPEKTPPEEKPEPASTALLKTTPRKSFVKRYSVPIVSSYIIVFLILVLTAFTQGPKAQEKVLDTQSARQEIADAVAISNTNLKNNLSNQHVQAQNVALQETPTPFFVANKNNVQAADVTTLASVSRSNETLLDDGKIKGDTKETLATTLGGVESMAGADTLQQVSVNPISGIVILAAGLLSLVLLFPKKLAFMGMGASGGAIHAGSKNIATTPFERILEVNQKTDGTIVLNIQGKEYKISKPELYSESDQFFERLMELVGPNTKEIDYVSFTDDKITLTTPLSRLVTRLGFVGIKRDLFFPRTSKDRVLFRKYLTAQDLLDMNITADQITTEITAVFEARSTQV